MEPPLDPSCYLHQWTNLPSKRVEINSTSAFEAMNTSKPPKGCLWHVVPIEHAYPNMLGLRGVQVTEMLHEWIKPCNSEWKGERKGIEISYIMHNRKYTYGTIDSLLWRIKESSYFCCIVSGLLYGAEYFPFNAQQNICLGVQISEDLDKCSSDNSHAW